MFGKILRDKGAQENFNTGKEDFRPGEAHFTCQDSCCYCVCSPVDLIFVEKRKMLYQIGNMGCFTLSNDCSYVESLQLLTRKAKTNPMFAKFAGI